MPVQATSHSAVAYSDVQNLYENIDTNDPESVNKFNEAMYQFQQGVAFDANFAAGWHSILKDLIQLLGRV